MFLGKYVSVSIDRYVQVLATEMYTVSKGLFSPLVSNIFKQKDYNLFTICDKRIGFSDFYQELSCNTNRSLT